MHVGVRDQQDLVARGRQHVDEVGDLSIGTGRAGAGDEGDIAVREACGEAACDGEPRVGRVGGAADDLKIRIVLAAERGERLLEQRLFAGERLEHRDRRAPVRRGRGLAGEAAHEEEPGQPVRKTSESDQRKECGKGVHERHGDAPLTRISRAR